MAGSDQPKPQLLRSTAAVERLMISLVIFLFFARGFFTVLLYSLMPRLKTFFQLSYAETMLTQFSFFLAHLIFSLPAAYVLARIGFLRAIVVGLVVMIVGCLTFSPAALVGLYCIFLAALFAVGAGITLLQVAANPFIAVLGPPQGSYSRLTLAQAFNSLGTTVGPLVGAWLILGSANLSSSNATSAVRVADVRALQFPFIIIAGVLAAVALVFWLIRTCPVPETDASGTTFASGFQLLKSRRFLLGTVSMFAYVGAEVSVASIIVDYLQQATVLSIPAFRANQLLSLYWGGAMCGRFVGSAALRVVSPAIALSSCSGIAALLTILSLCTTGNIAAAAIIAIGLFNSIMFPTIFTIAIYNLGDSTPQGSGILCMAIVGGAVMPAITGIVVDMKGLTFALLVPAACYVWIAIYGTYVGRHSLHDAGTTKRNLSPERALPDCNVESN